MVIMRGHNGQVLGFDAIEDDRARLADRGVVQRSNDMLHGHAR